MPRAVKAKTVNLIACLSLIVTSQAKVKSEQSLADPEDVAVTIADGAGQCKLIGRVEDLDALIDKLDAARAAGYRWG